MTVPNFTTERIAEARKVVEHSYAKQFLADKDGEGYDRNFHPDGRARGVTDTQIKIACQWIDAQERISRNMGKAPRKFIETWADTYIPREAVEIAARLMKLKGEYGKYNISISPIYPLRERLEGLCACEIDELPPTNMRGYKRYETSDGDVRYLRYKRYDEVYG